MAASFYIKVCVSLVPVPRPLDRKRGPENNGSAARQACFSYTFVAPPHNTNKDDQLYTLVARPHNMNNLHQLLQITVLARRGQHLEWC